MEALQEELLRRDFAQQGLFVVDIRRSGGGVAAATVPRLQQRRPIRMASIGALQRLVHRVKLTDLLLFSGQLAAMLEGGLHLLRSLRALATDIPNKRFRRSIERVASDVEAGSSFADALEQHPWAFNKIFVTLSRVGEAASELPAALNQLTIYLEKSATLRKKDRKSTRLNSSHIQKSRMPSSA